MKITLHMVVTVTIQDSRGVVMFERYEDLDVILPVGCNVRMDTFHGKVTNVVFHVGDGITVEARMQNVKAFSVNIGKKAIEWLVGNGWTSV